MKKLLILPLLALLSGCVTYYYPETALEDGVYYAEDDPSYTVYSDSYVSVGYYPWYSLDYFYLGYYPYPRYRVGYGYPGSFYFGFSYGFSPWYYPGHYYGYYSPWYASYGHYPYYPAWRPYRGYYAHHHGDRYWKKKHHDRGHDRYPGGHDRYGERDRHDRYAGRGDRDYRHDRGRDDYTQARRERDQDSHGDSTKVRRYVSTAPSGRSGERGVVVRSRESTKIGKSKLEAGKQDGLSTARVTTTDARATLPTYSVRHSGSEVRYRSSSKPSRSRTEPVSSKTTSRAIRPTGTSTPRVTVNGAKRPSASAPRGGQSSVRVAKTAPTSSRSQPPRAKASNSSRPSVAHSSTSGRSSKKSPSRSKNHR
ncbi:MAG: hypothetical protein PVF46_04195 [Lysobacterales bacterium]|jgi:hypothetical protein